VPGKYDQDHQAIDTNVRRPSPTSHDINRGPVQSSLAGPPANYQHISKRKTSCQRKEPVNVQLYGTSGFQVGTGADSSYAGVEAGSGGVPTASSNGYYKSKHEKQMEEAMKKFMAKKEGGGGHATKENKNKSGDDGSNDVSM